jgi:hypothetical protein
MANVAHAIPLTLASAFLPTEIASRLNIMTWQLAPFRPIPNQCLC